MNSKHRNDTVIRHMHCCFCFAMFMICVFWVFWCFGVLVFGNVLLWFPLLGPTFEAVFESVLVLLVRVLLVTKLAPRGSLDSVNKTGSWQLAEGES